MTPEAWKKKILEKINFAAREGCFLYYEELLALSDDDKPDRRELYDILDSINGDIRGCVPSALVIDENLGMPGSGFFRKQRERGGRRTEENFPFFARLAREVFRFYRAPENYGVLVDADHVSAKAVANLLRKDNKYIVCRAYGNNAEWGNKFLKEKYPVVEFFHTPEQEQSIKSATDFRLYAQGLRLVREIHDKRILDILYVMSCDKGFKHFTDAVKKDGVDVVWLDNHGKSHPLG